MHSNSYSPTTKQLKAIEPNQLQENKNQLTNLGYLTFAKPSDLAMLAGVRRCSSGIGVQYSGEKCHIFVNELALHAPKSGRIQTQAKGGMVAKATVTLPNL
ncbi:MAG: hypothetical protein HOI95_06210 [Chromatiales bacterium]|jgi:hypothetical protein|nr:hypothetical protein [Chromatiales bacterium]